MKRPLEGIKVLDLTRVLAGPFCCMLLGDMGAEVVKVERPEKGDDVRTNTPQVGGQSTYFLVLNRNKRSITLNFRHPEAKSILFELVRHADVLVENFRAGTLEEMGCGYDRLQDVNPRLILTRISGFGQDGPYADRTCFDAAAQAISGLMDITGPADGPPMMTGSFLVDYGTGLNAVIGTLAALRAREFTQVGQLVDVALLDTAVSYMITAIPDYLLCGQQMTRRGNLDRYAWPANVYQARDGRWVYLHAGMDNFFAKLTQIMGREELLQDPRFKDRAAREQHIQEVDVLVRDWVASCTSDEVVQLVAGGGIPCARVNTVSEMVEDPQVRHRGMIAEVDHPTAGRVPMPGLTIHFSDTPSGISLPPPLLGQHNEEVYREWLGFTPEHVGELTARGVI